MTGGWLNRQKPKRKIKTFVSQVMLGFSQGDRVEWLSVCVTWWKTSLHSLDFSSFCHLSLIPCRLQGDLQNSIPAVGVCVERIVKGGWHSSLCNVNIPFCGDAPALCMWVSQGQMCYIVVYVHMFGDILLITCGRIFWAACFCLTSPATENEGLRSSH